MTKTLTIVVPVFNEQEVLPELLSRLAHVLDELQASHIESTVLFIDDGSSDRTFSLIQEYQKKDARFGWVQLSRNFGHQSAINAGLDHVKTDAVVVIDGDLQDPPELIVSMATLWSSGQAEVVYGQREKREGSIIKRMLYSAFYRLFNHIVDTKVPPDTGDFALMDRRVYTLLCQFPERVRFLRGLRSWVGFRQVALLYNRPDRFAGKTKYTYRRLFNLATDGIASFSVEPLRIAQTFAFLWFTATMLYAFWTLAISEMDSISGLIVLLGLSMSMLFLCVYILGAYIWRTYLEAKHRPLYIAADFRPGSVNEASNDMRSRQSSLHHE